MERKNKIQRISVIGPGMMGHAIAQEFAVAGFDVTLCGRDENRLEEAMEKIENSLQELAQWELISKDEIDPALSRLVTTTDLEAAGSGADFIVESIVEVLEVKEKLFARLDAICPQHTILASNTSSLIPSTLAASTWHPDRFLIAHYFNPPYLMPLVEIVKGEHTADDEVINGPSSVRKKPWGLSSTGCSWCCGGRPSTLCSGELHRPRMWTARSKIVSEDVWAWWAHSNFTNISMATT
ncbi:MAG: NAD(P)-binding domain-containing protein [Deltaproteobacteria bacterium]|nr:NAD(P)-binding domain-containing protein [Deltaproteobacteria bacterium]